MLDSHISALFRTHFTKKHHREMRLLQEEAKLRSDWQNILEHQITVAIAVHALCHALQYSEKRTNQLERFALIHDADKHLKQAPEDFSEEEKYQFKEKIGALWQELDSDGYRRFATNEAFLDRIFQKDDPVPLPTKELYTRLSGFFEDELLLYYIDAITLASSISPALTRISETEKQSPLNKEEKRTQRLGRKYWDAEREIAPIVERIIWEWMREKDRELATPENLPDFIQQKMNESMLKYWLKTHNKQSITLLLHKGSTMQTDAVCDSRRIKPELNEDTAIIREEGDVIIVGIFDGATNIGTELPISPGKAAAIACRETIAAAPSDISPTDMLLRANTLIGNIAAGLPLADEERKEILCAVGAVARIDRKNNMIDIASVDDCHIVLLHADASHTWLTENTSKHIELLEIAAAQKAENPAQPLEDQCVIDVIAQCRRLENAPDGRGAPSLKGSENAILKTLIQTRSIPLRKNDIIIFFTDGAYPGPLYTKEQQEEVVKVIKQGGIQELQRWVRGKEDADPDLRKYPRMKQYDDLIALSITT